MNGDMIFDTYNDISTVDYILSQIFLYLFISLSIMVIQNVFIVIIEDGYMISKFRSKNDWLSLKTKRESEGDEYRRIHMQAHGITPFNFQDQTYDAVPSTQKNKKNSVPTESNPFAKIRKRHKKDIKSREALVKLLWHDKITHNMEKAKQDDFQLSSVQNQLLSSPNQALRFEEKEDESISFTMKPAESKSTDNSLKSNLKSVELSCKNLMTHFNNESEKSEDVREKYMNTVHHMKKYIENLENHIKNNS